MNHIAEEILMHRGVSKLDGAPGPGSGRYPLGSGDSPYQHRSAFLIRIEQLQKDGLSEKEIAEAVGLTTLQLRAKKSIEKDQERAMRVETAKRLREEGLSLNEIARKMGYANDSSVRSLLDEQSEARMNQAKKTADFLKEICDKKGMLDVGTGVEKELGVSREKLNEALEILKQEGYETYGGGLPQATNPGKQINLKVLCPPGTEHKEIFNYDKVNSVLDYDYILTEDGTKKRKAFEYPASMDSKRLKIRYAEEGGIDKDGTIEIRRGVKDLSLGDSHYAQVRILVDGTHYIKGMAFYSDDMPEGVDVIFNTNKKKGTPALGEKDNTVLKKIKNDPDNPFGSLIKERGGQSYYIGEDGKEHLSLINKRAEAGDWNSWSDHLPSQFLSKQPKELIEKQLNLTIAEKKAEHDEIISLTNPTIKKAMLNSFADDCDAAAVHLKAAALPRQKYQVILPLTTINDNEVYAPNYINGEKVALIRYPHGGTFEIPILTVNNKQPEGQKVIGNDSRDAIGINSHVANRLSGADFDGDTVMVIPTNSKVRIKSTNPAADPHLSSLASFDPKLEYGPDTATAPYKRMKDTQNQMGRVSNLITDMTLKGATTEELTRAVKHSMVVIDAEKHNLDYKRSYEENGIAALKKKYQGRVENGQYTEGASTLISRAKGQKSVLKRQGSPRVAEDGSLYYKTADDLTYVNKKGKTITRTQKSTQMAETKDARTLISEANTMPEVLYANYANTMKSLANQSRKEAMNTGRLKTNPSAKETYKTEVDSLKSKLLLAEKNAPRERRAQILANSEVTAKEKDNPDLTKEEKRKLKQQALTSSRAKVGAKRHPIDITDSEWDAIQSGAVSDNTLQQILKYSNSEDLKKRATPRASIELSSSKVSMIKALSNSGYTNAEIASKLGISASTVHKYL